MQLSEVVLGLKEEDANRPRPEEMNAVDSNR